MIRIIPNVDNPYYDEIMDIIKEVYQINDDDK